MRLRYNAPVTLTFSFIAFAVLVIGLLTAGTSTKLLFSLGAHMNAADPLSWVRLFTHVLGHANWDHLLGNLAFLLLLGPILEEKYGSRSILVMIFITALATAILNILLFSTGLLGASGVVFMFILLASFTNIRSGDLPLTFILIVAIYITREIVAAFHDDSISQFAHIIGGTLGSVFGFFMAGSKKA